MITGSSEFVSTGQTCESPGPSFVAGIQSEDSPCDRAWNSYCQYKYLIEFFKYSIGIKEWNGIDEQKRCLVLEARSGNTKKPTSHV